MLLLLLLEIIDIKVTDYRKKVPVCHQEVREHLLKKSRVEKLIANLLIYFWFAAEEISNERYFIIIYEVKVHFEVGEKFIFYLPLIFIILKVDVGKVCEVFNRNLKFLIELRSDLILKNLL